MTDVPSAGAARKLAAKHFNESFKLFCSCVHALGIDAGVIIPGSKARLK